MKVYCQDCKYSKKITPEIRLRLSQENKEILNKLLSSRYQLNEFLYCEKDGFLESAISKKDCESYEPKFC